MLKYAHAASFLLFCSVSGNASLGTVFLPSSAKFRENATLARHILPAGEKGVCLDVSDCPSFVFCSETSGFAYRGPVMGLVMVDSCHAARGRLSPCFGKRGCRGVLSGIGHRSGIGWSRASPRNCALLRNWPSPQNRALLQGLAFALNSGMCLGI